MQRILLSLVAVSMLSVVPSLAHAQGISVVVPGVRVGVAPPPLRAEVRPPAPSAAHVWIPGHWVWRGRAHAWVGGHYALPPGNGYHWVSARWANEGGQWTFFEGHWAMSQPTSPTYVYDPGPAPAQEVVTQEQPPEPIVEVRPAAPFGGAVWIPGYWGWNGYRHNWVGGHWSAPRAGWSWEPNRWQRTPRGWVHTPGHWRRG
jgi:YXWGXW repeat-containing protein